MKQATATAEQAWTAVRCPCGKSVLAEVSAGSQGAIRRFCRRCKALWVIDLGSGKVHGAAPLR